MEPMTRRPFPSPLVRPPRTAESSTFYWLWFSFLRMARKSSDPKIKAALAKSREFYEPWGDVEDEDFWAWWESHLYLFEEYTVRRLSKGEAPIDSEALVIEVPLRETRTEILKAVRKVINDALKEQGRAATKSMSMRRASSRFRRRAGSEPQLHKLDEARIVYLFRHDHPELEGQALLAAIRTDMQGYINPFGKKVLPAVLEIDSVGGIGVPLKALRRCIAKAEALLLNVARGEFPGRLPRG